MDGTDGRARCKRLHISPFLCPILQCGKGPWKSSGSSASTLKRRATSPELETDVPTHNAAAHSFHRAVCRGWPPLESGGCRGQVVLRCPRKLWVHLTSH